MSPGDEVGDAVARARRAFDASFAEAPVAGAAAGVDIVAARVAGRSMGLRRADLAGVSCEPRIVPLPGAAPTVLGLSSMRGLVLPVLSLARVLGLAPVAGERWVAWVDGDHPVGFAFEGVDGMVCVPPENLASVGEAGAPLGGTARVGVDAWPLIDLVSVARAGIPRPPGA